MKTRLIIEKKGLWQFRLHVAPHMPGSYYATLRNEDGGRIKHGPVIGPFLSLDLIVEQADTIYQRLVDMFGAGYRPIEKPTGALNGDEEILHDGRWVRVSTLPNYDDDATYQWRAPVKPIGAAAEVVPFSQ